MMPIHVLKFEDGRCNHPRTHKRNARSVFDRAYSWMKQNHPDGLYSKANKEGGIRLLSDPMSLFWAIIVREGEKPLARLFLGSGYDGARGGAPGLGYDIWQLTRELDEDGKPVADVTNPAEGRMICVEKTMPKGSRYPSYSLRVGRQPAPIADLLAKMSGNYSTWEQFLRAEAFRLLDFQLPAGLKDEVGDTVDDGDRIIAQEVLAERTLIIAAGAFQGIWEKRSRPTLGFGKPETSLRTSLP